MRRSYYKRAIALVRVVALDNNRTGEAARELLREIDTPVPTKSTTHREMLFHFNERNGQTFGSGAVIGGTVFFREESDGWYCSVARCIEGDTFSHKIGRAKARRRYFEEPQSCRQAEDHMATPIYEIARVMYCTEPMRKEG